MTNKEENKIIQKLSLKLIGDMGLIGVKPR
jgi:hypothetical protein